MIVPSIALVVSLIGFSLSAYIYIKKGGRRPIVCPLRANCHTVLYSRFAKTFGVRNELLGMLYYLSVWVLYAFVLTVPVVATPGFYVLLAVLTAGAFLFSLYLTAVQAFVLKSWCSWCLFSALCNAALFALLFFAIPFWSLAAFLESYRSVVLGVHTIGFILGAGAAIITDILFFRFLKDHIVSDEEKGTLDTLSGVIWAGLALLVFSGLALYLPDMQILNASPKFLVKAIAVGVILVNGFALNFRIAPHLTQLSFDRAPASTRLRRLAFALGGISIVSWLAALFLGMAHSMPFSLEEGIVGYLSLLVCTVVVSQIAERALVRHEPKPEAVSAESKSVN